MVNNIMAHTFYIAPQTQELTLAPAMGMLIGSTPVVGDKSLPVTPTPSDFTAE